mmetsp:Transcript_7286/g.17311  ORF Transcript_7286/g.17311 Transcript_7286/m.17311 type:complete len:206 (+) Transcript_7286:774-1391(+)
MHACVLWEPSALSPAVQGLVAHGGGGLGQAQSPFATSQSATIEPDAHGGDGEHASIHAFRNCNNLLSTVTKPRLRARSSEILERRWDMVPVVVAKVILVLNNEGRRPAGCTQCVIDAHANPHPCKHLRVVERVQMPLKKKEARQAQGACGQQVRDYAVLSAFDVKREEHGAPGARQLAHVSRQVDSAHCQAVELFAEFARASKAC